MHAFACGRLAKEFGKGEDRTGFGLRPDPASIFISDGGGIRPPIEQAGYQSRSRKAEGRADEHRPPGPRDRHRYACGSDPAGWYWSSSQNNNNAWDQRFSDGNQCGYDEVMQEPADVFEIVRTVGLGLPDVEATTKYDGSPVLKLGGCFMAGLATHRSAEPDTLVVRVGFEDRELLIEDAPETYYLTEYYRRYPLVLVRLSRVDREALSDLL